MTFVGKVLVVVQVVLSVFFMAFAGAVFTVQTNWKEAHDQKDKDLQEARAKQQTAESQLEQLRQEAQAALAKKGAAADPQFGSVVKQALAEMEKETTLRMQYQSEKDTLQTEMDTLKEELERQGQDLERQRELTQVHAQEAEARRKEAEQQRKLNTEVHERLDQATAKNVKLEDELFVTKRDLEARDEQLQVALLENERLVKLLRANEINPDAEPSQLKSLPPDGLEGYVLKSEKSRRSSTEFVEITLGGDDGLEEGHLLYVYRTTDGGKYLGRIRIVLITPDRAVGTIVERAKNSTIQRGDHVSTKL